MRLLTTSFSKFGVSHNLYFDKYVWREHSRHSTIEQVNDLSDAEAMKIRGDFDPTNSSGRGFNGGRNLVSLVGQFYYIKVILIEKSQKRRT